MKTAAVLAALGIGTAIQAADLIPKAKPTAFRSRKNSCRNGTGRNTSRLSRRPSGYLNYVADKFDLRRDIQLASRVTSAVYDAPANRWEVVINDKQRAR